MADERALEVWVHLADLFGPEALLRKFGKAPNRAWEELIASVSDYELDRGFRRLVRTGAATVPTLPQFAKLCRELPGPEDDRPAAPVSQQAWAGDWYEQIANQRLLRYFLVAIPTQRGVAEFTAEVTEAFVAYKRAYAQDLRESTPLSWEEQTRQWNDCMARAEAHTQIPYTPVTYARSHFR